jgi:hypothetical protein
MLIHYFKSAVAFFFLFFLHGASIGTRQQGISYNGFGLGEGGLVGCSNLAGCFCPLLPNPCYTLFVLIFCAVGKLLN